MKKISNKRKEQNRLVNTTISSSFVSQNPFINYNWLCPLINNEPEYGDGCIDKIRIKIPEGNIDQSFLIDHCKKWSHGLINGARYTYDGVVPFTILNYGRGFNVLDMNPSEFPSFKEFKSFCKQLYGDLKLGVITRLDCAVLLNSKVYPTQLFDLSCYVKYKRKHSGFTARKFDYKRGRLSGVDWGKHPHKVQAYDKDCSPHYKGPRPAYLTNFEAQLSKPYVTKMLDINDITELWKLMKKSPFKRVQFADIFRKKPLLSHQEKKRYRWLQDTCKYIGFHNAKALIQKETGNYYRDYQKLVCPLYVSNENISIKKLILRSFRRGFKKWYEMEQPRTNPLDVFSATRVFDQKVNIASF